MFARIRHWLAKGIVGLDELLAKVFSPISKFLCWLTGASYYTLALIGFVLYRVLHFPYPIEHWYSPTFWFVWSVLALVAANYALHAIIDFLASGDDAIPERVWGWWVWLSAVRCLAVLGLLPPLLFTRNWFANLVLAVCTYGIGEMAAPKRESFPSKVKRLAARISRSPSLAGAPS